MNMIELYTRQHENSVYELENKGVMTNKAVYVRLHMGDIADWFIGKYDLFVEMAEKKVKRPVGNEYPIWCSVSRDNCLKPIEKEVVYCLSVPEEEVIYFDGTKWDYVLNNLYIPKDEADELRFRKKIEELGVEDRFSFIEGKYKGWYPDVEAEIRESWHRIFEIDEWNIFRVQANLWRIKKEWVRRIVRSGEEI